MGTSPPAIGATDSPGPWTATAGAPAVDDISQRRLALLTPALRCRMERLLHIMALAGAPMRVTDGIRTVEEQARLFAKGRTTPGRIVTHADGVRVRSFHQTGRAADCAFKLADGRIIWDGPWTLYGAAAEALGLRWGGRWKAPLVDRPHVELPSHIESDAVL